MNSLKKYKTAYEITWKQALDYRFEFIMEIICTFVPVIALTFLWEAVYLHRDNLQGYTIEAMLTYMLISRFVTVIVTPNFFFDVMTEIQEGAIQQYICKPVNYIKFWFAKALGNKSRNFIFGIVSLVIIVIVFNKGIYIDYSVKKLSLFLVAFVLSYILYFGIMMMVALLSFWFYEISSWYYTLTFAIGFLSGGLLPLDLYPEKLLTICNILPFRFLVYLPTSILTGAFNEKELIYSFTFQSMWILLIYIILSVLWNKGVKRYELIGG